MGNDFRKRVKRNMDESINSLLLISVQVNQRFEGLICLGKLFAYNECGFFTEEEYKAYLQIICSVLGEEYYEI